MVTNISDKQQKVGSDIVRFSTWLGLKQEYLLQEWKYRWVWDKRDMATMKQQKSRLYQTVLRSFAYSASFHVLSFGCPYLIQNYAYKMGKKNLKQG